MQGKKKQGNDKRLANAEILNAPPGNRMNAEWPV